MRVGPLYIIGAGGIGCAVGYALCAAGAAVTFVDADRAKVRWGRSHGVRVDRRRPRQAAFEVFDDWTAAPGATVLLCIKCYDNEAVLARLPATATVIPIQNGFDRSLEARGDFLEGIASFVSECYPHRPHTRITRRGRLHLGLRSTGGRPHGRRHTGPNAHPLAGWLRCAAPFRVEVVPDILPFKYTKLMYNAAIGPLAAVAGLDNGALLAVPRARHLFFALLRENYSILRDAGVALERIGPFHPVTVDRILHRLPLARALAWAFYPTLRRTYCSMVGDLPAGRTEIDFYNRHLIDLAGDRPCPLNRRLYDLVKRMERERQPPSLKVFDELA
jgi:2-dehydropantoate 2-reductase